MNNDKKLEDLFAFQIKALKLVEPEREYRFHETRRWRFDFAWVASKFAVEIDGGEWVNGGHNRGLGMANDCEKMGEAMLLGWDVYRCTGSMVTKGNAIGFVEAYHRLMDLK